MVLGYTLKVMKKVNKKLVIAQLDKKIAVGRVLKDVPPPSNGWIAAARTALNMSLKQLGKRLGISPPSVKELELREKTGSITMNGLRQAAQALDMRLVYILVPNEGSLDAFIEKTASRLAAEIVNRTSQTMKLENQGNSEERIAQAIKEKTEELIREMPSFLWD